MTSTARDDAADWWQAAQEMAERRGLDLDDPEALSEIAEALDEIAAEHRARRGRMEP